MVLLLPSSIMSVVVIIQRQLMLEKFVKTWKKMTQTFHVQLLITMLILLIWEKIFSVLLLSLLVLHLVCHQHLINLSLLKMLFISLSLFSLLVYLHLLPQFYVQISSQLLLIQLVMYLNGNLVFLRPSWLFSLFQPSIFFLTKDLIFLNSVFHLIFLMLIDCMLIVVLYSDFGLV